MYQDHVCITAVDYDIGIIRACYFSIFINTTIYVRTGLKNRQKILDVKEITSEICENVGLVLPALHAFTGNDYTSAFLWHRKGESIQTTAVI